MSELTQALILFAQSLMLALGALAWRRTRAAQRAAVTSEVAAYLHAASAAGDANRTAAPAATNPAPAPLPFTPLDLHAEPATIPFPVELASPPTLAFTFPPRIAPETRDEGA